jgi:hypothetical protein
MKIASFVVEVFFSSAVCLLKSDLSCSYGHAKQVEFFDTVFPLFQDKGFLPRFTTQPFTGYSAWS